MHQEDDRDNKPTYRGWRKAVMVATATTGAVALINIILGVVFAKRYPTNDKGLVTLKQGDCEAVKRINTMVHLAINILSTALLGASNYTMQCLGSPTRAEVNAAHLKGKSLYIGVPSIRNFLHMNPLKGVLWLCLCLSTLPLHFLYVGVICFNHCTTINLLNKSDSILGGIRPFFQPVQSIWLHMLLLTKIFFREDTLDQILIQLLAMEVLHPCRLSITSTKAIERTRTQISPSRIVLSGIRKVVEWTREI